MEIGELLEKELDAVKILDRLICWTPSDYITISSDEDDVKPHASSTPIKMDQHVPSTPMKTEIASLALSPIEVSTTATKKGALFGCSPIVKGKKLFEPQVVLLNR